ncbi:subunit Psf3 of DNA replication GINS complex [Chloropicon primus]|uniref:Subunit Psf3 of DNA replication GINS complex n=1 Tax=Chloropicon primus TaxID=1764295 RepID=A0A5B8MCL7_9CHLO|nr:subunit Psf3 of DNA replication GINS complex [Chloropicon primus]UPQ97341.1 subunit Psf3 of DNA replication GINS complex [Chloropicon primus]|mmetsp:Transcript_3162/g.8737  ORF Transcript_3162/g.8737 Transcript_3162/m.8737 type:complete len:206 (+) Transcript_3162:222-839(+)|eukprot:QDZ18129.1 subunit Psf3 of DNA replication GINS complex [Chloropicon primus]
MAKYYDVDDILAEEETLPTVFNTSVYGLGRALDPSCDSKDLPVGSNVNLPFWLADFLSRRKMLKPHLPKFLKKKLRDELQGEAECVDLRDRCKFFYELGRKLCTLQNLDGSEDLSAFLLNTFTSRFTGMLTTSHICSNEKRQNYTKVLSNEELELFVRAQASSKAFEKWIYSKGLKISSRIKRNKRKREWEGQEFRFRTRPVVSA